MNAEQAAQRLSDLQLVLDQRLVEVERAERALFAAQRAANTQDGAVQEAQWLVNRLSEQAEETA